MIFHWLLALLAATTILCACPFGERAARRILVLGAALAAIVGAYAIRDFLAVDAFGYADMWLGGGTSAIGLALVLASSLLVALVAYVTLGASHLHGSLTLAKLRAILVALASFSFFAVVAVVSDNIWLSLASCFALVAIAILASGRSRTHLIAVGGFAVALGLVAKGFFTSAMPTMTAAVAWNHFTFTNLASTRLDEWYFIGAWALALVVLGATFGVAPFVRRFDAFTDNVGAEITSAIRSVLAIATTMTFLRLTFVTNQSLDAEPRTQSVMLAAGVLSMVWALVVFMKHRDIDRARMMFLGAVTLFVAGIGPAGMIVALMLLVARATMAPLAAIARVPLLLSSVFISLLIMFGYGVQMQPTLAVIMLVLVGVWMVAEWQSWPAVKSSPAKLGLRDKLAYGLALLQIIFALLLMTPPAIAIAVGSLNQLTSSL